MRYFILLLLFAALFSASTCKVHREQETTVKENPIEKLVTDTDVIEFIERQVPQFSRKANKKSFILKPVKQLYRDEKLHIIIDSLSLKSWYREDFNHDGLQDLLIFGHDIENEPLIVLGSTTDTYTMLSLKREQAVTEYLPIAEKINDLWYIRNYETAFRFTADGGEEYLRDYLLTIKDNALIEYPLPQKEYSVSKIAVYQSGRVGGCPRYGFSINKDGEVKLAEMSRDKQAGVYKKTIATTTIEEIWEWVQRIDLKNLAPRYESGMIDNIHVHLVILHSDGSYTEVSDDGKSGTFGLRELYAKIGAIYTSEGFTFVRSLSDDQQKIDLKKFME